MKCDELKTVCYIDAYSTMPVYGAKVVDEAIAELQAENQRLSNALDKEHSETIKYMDELCNAKNEIERLTIDKRNVELMADIANSTIEKLKKKMDDYHLMSDIRRAKIKELKRALWLARAERYKMREFIAREEANLRDQIAWSQYLRERTYNQWVGQLLRIANLANKLQNKCRAKAEEYK